MADPFNPKFVDLVRNYTTTVGTGDFALGPAVNGFTGLAAALSAGDRFYYACVGIDKPAEREVGRGTLTAGGTIVREPVTGTKTSFTTGNKAIALVAAAEWYTALATLADQVASLGSGGTKSVADRAEMAGLNTASNSLAMLREAGREGLFVWTAANLSAMVTADPRQGIYVAPAAAPTGASGAWVRKFDGSVNAKWFGLTGDNATDNHAALQGAIDTLFALRAVQHGYGRGSASLFVPATTDAYYCSQKLVIQHSLVMEFEIGAGATGGAAELRFPAGQGGILIKYDGTTGGGAGSIVKNPQLNGGFSTTEGEFHGIEFQTACRIENAKVFNFQGDGIFCDTNGTGFNANGAVIDNPFIQSCRNGLYLKGEDTNALTVINPVTIANRRYGQWQKLTLGSALIGGDSSTNGALGIGGTIPFTMCSYSGNRYYVLPNQDVAASTIAPSGTSANNSVWGFWGSGGASTEFPAWVTGTQTFRSGGAARFEGAFEQNVSVAYYVEGDQAPIQMVGGPQMLFLGSMCGHPVLENGDRYGGVITGGTAGTNITGSLSLDGSLMSGKDIYINLNNQYPAYDPTLHINTTNAYATLQYEVNGASKAVVQYGLGSMYYILQTAGSHIFYTNGAMAAVLDSSIGFDLKIGAYKVNGTSVISSAGLLQAAAFPALSGDVTTAAGSLSATIASGAVSLAKMANMASASLIYRKTAGSGAPEVQTLATLKTDLGLTGTNSGDQVISLTGDVTGSGSGSFAASIAAGAVGLTKMANLAANSIIGNNTGSAAAPAALTAAQAKALLAIGASDVSGLSAVASSGSAVDLASGTLPAARLPALTGDVTTSAGSAATAIAAGAVTYAKIQNVAASRLIGNPGGASAAASEISLAGGLAFSGSTLTAAGALTPTSVASSGAVTSSAATGGMGYATGAGGAVTQATSKATGVTLNKASGQVTMNAAALAAAAIVEFTVTSSAVAATDTINLNLASGAATSTAYRYWVSAVAAGSFKVCVENRSAGSLSEALVLNFAVVKAVAA